MAKNALGRGLGSLLGGSYEESAPQPAVQHQVAPTYQSSYASPAPAAPIRERINMGHINAATGEIIEDTPHVETSAPVVVEEKPVEIAPDVEEPQEEKVPEELPLEMIEPNLDQPRINFKKEELEELSASIKKDGLLQPILVRPKGDKYEIIAGERRYRASKLAGLEKVPVRIKIADDEESLELALIENIQRSDLNPIEEAYGYKRLMEKKNLTQSEVAQMVSKGRSTIANALRLLDLPEDAQKLLYEEKITAGHARAILSIPTAEGRAKLTQKLIDSKMSVREAESFARLLTMNAQPKKESSREPMPKSYKKVARTLRDRLETGVKIKSSQGRNRIEIEFKDEEDLQRLFAAMFVQEKPAAVQPAEAASESDEQE